MGRSALRSKCHRLLATTRPKILIFDIDGVLVDVRGTYGRSALETVQYLSGKQATYAELRKWKNKPGYNDDWRMTAAWVTALGRPTTYEEARAAFEKFYWGTQEQPGNVRNEKFLITPTQIGRLARRFELNLFTGRNRREYSFSFDRWPCVSHFRSVVTMDDVKHVKPHPEGLLKILAKRDPASALYIGDNIDDALSARAARVPFLAVVQPGEPGAGQRSARFRELGAVAVLPRVTGLGAWLRRRYGSDSLS